MRFAEEARAIFERLPSGVRPSSISATEIRSTRFSSY